MPGVSRRDEIGDAEAPFRQPVIGAPVDGFGHELGFKEELPEPVGVAGEMMSRFGGADARVDADKQHADAWRDTVAKWGHGP